jgi:ABC-type branched-subunit amino acid transport system ATPase component
VKLYLSVKLLLSDEPTEGFGCDRSNASHEVICRYPRRTAESFLMTIHLLMKVADA